MQHISQLYVRFKDKNAWKEGLSRITFTTQGGEKVSCLDIAQGRRVDFLEDFCADEKQADLYIRSWWSEEQLKSVIQGLKNRQGIDCVITGSYTNLNTDSFETVYYVLNGELKETAFVYEDAEAHMRVSMSNLSLWFSPLEFLLNAAQKDCIMRFERSTGQREPEQGSIIQIENGVLLRYTRAPESLVLPSSISVIGKGALEGNHRLKSVVIPNSVIRIEQGAFVDCPNLSSVSFADGLEEIGERAFGGYSQLDFEKGIAPVATACTELKALSLPKSLRCIGRLAFARCGVEKIEIPGSVKDMQVGFAQCSALEEVTIAEGVTEIGKSCFAGCSGLKKISLPSTIREIKEFAFAGCTSLQEIRLPDKLEVIEKYAFAGCSKMDTLRIPRSVRSLNSGSVAEVRHFEVEELNPYYQMKNDCLLGKNGTHMLCTVPSATEIHVPEGVNSIDAFYPTYLFYNESTSVDTLTRLTLPNSLRKLGEYAASMISNEIEELILPAQVEELPTRESLPRCQKLTILGEKLVYHGGIEAKMIMAPQLPFSTFNHPETRAAAALGYMEMVVRNEEIRSEIGADYVAFIKRQRKKLLSDYIFKNYALYRNGFIYMIETGLLGKKEIELFQKELAALQDAEVMDMMRNKLTRYLDIETIA